MLLKDLLDVAELQSALADGLVRAQRHPSQPLVILNYTEQAVFSRAWAPVTRACRGLVVRTPGPFADAVVVARPWPKFFNHGELPALGITLDPAAPVEVTDKADGSLGILYRGSSGWAVATRGSSTSEQALHASQVWRDRYADRWAPPTGWTVLLEIVYPANRIVLDYGGLDDLVLLGAVEIATGRAAGPLDGVLAGWPGPRVDVHEHPTFADALAAPPRPDAEGLVVRVVGGPAEGLQVKIKESSYVQLHRLVTGLTARRLWEHAAVRAASLTGSRRPGLQQRCTSTPRTSPCRCGPAPVAAGPTSCGPAFPRSSRTGSTRPSQGSRRPSRRCGPTSRRPRPAWPGCPAVTRRRPSPATRTAGSSSPLLDGKPVTAQLWAAVRPPAERPFRMRSEDVA